jgi:lipoprotein-anchoring transpeptidase ErfK/SrfK
MRIFLLRRVSIIPPQSCQAARDKSLLWREGGNESSKVCFWSGGGGFVSTRGRRCEEKEEENQEKGAEVVEFATPEKIGTVIVDTDERALYHVIGRETAIRYGVAVGMEGFAWAGIAEVGRKVKWPRWTPPRNMIKRKPELWKWRNGMPGGPKNPLGARAIYLFKNGRDTLFRIHGTNEPESIGSAASSGCIRMLNEEVTELYESLPIGAKVIVL